MVPYLSPAWSIGVEEQFYIIWPILVHFSRHYLRNFLLLAAGIYLVGQLSWFLTAPNRHIVPINEATTFIKNFLFFFRIQCMAIGGVFALVLFRNWTRVLRLLTARPVQAALWLVLPVLIVRGQTFRYCTQEVYGVLFGLLVLNLALTATSLVNLRHPVLDYLGRISYGLYLLHSLTAVVGLRVATLLVAGTNPLNHVLTYVLAVGLAVGLAALSYRYLETPFLRLKSRFTRIKSGA